MKLFSTNTIRVPADLSQVTQYAGDEQPAEAGGLHEGDIAHIWQSIEALYRTGNHPMISVCLRRKGQILLHRAIGHAEGNGPEDSAQTPKRLAQPDTPVCLFSASKLVTAMLLHYLDEQGTLNLLDPVTRYVPEYGQKGKSRSTLFHLLSHRGGIPRIPKGFPPEMFYDREAIVQALCRTEPISPSGHRQAYHAITAGYILGEVMERVTGMGLRELLDEVIVRPMGLSCFNYGLAPEFRDQVARNYATGLYSRLGTDQFLEYVLGGDLQLAVNMTNDVRFMDTVCPAGNLYTSAEQMGRFMEMLLDGGQYRDQSILSPATVFRSTLETTRRQFDAVLIAPLRYGLGPMLGDHPVGIFGPQTKHAFGHIGLSNIFCWADPQRDLSVSLLTTGKSVVGTHLPALLKVLWAINTHCPSLPRPQRRSIFGQTSDPAQAI